MVPGSLFRATPTTDRTETTWLNGSSCFSGGHSEKLCATGRHQIELLAKLRGRVGDMAEPLAKFGGCVEAAEIKVTRAVSEPAAYLHEGVIHS